MIWYRVDNRLIHGQVIEAWLPYTRATRLIVCNDGLAGDMLRQQIMLLAVPSRITVEFVAVNGLAAALPFNGSEKILVLMADCADARKVYDSGVHFGTLNIGNMHYSPGKRQVCEHVALSEADSACLHVLAGLDVKLDFRCVPNDTTEVTDW